ncbi:MAG: 50S ribosomal protein L18 [Alphaproteobacteria bacterium]
MNSRKVKEIRKFRVRSSLKKNSVDRLRLTVHRTANHIYGQIVDDQKRITVVSCSSLDGEFKKSISGGANKAAAVLVGSLLAKRALAAGISKVYFDRGAHVYQGRLASLADAARENGLVF